MIKRYNIYLLLMLLALFFPTSCSDDGSIATPSFNGGGKVHFTIGVSLPGASISESRAFGDAGIGSGGYYEFSDLYVAVFVTIDGVSYLEEFVKADNTVPIWNAKNGCWDFGVTLTQTDGPRRLHIIANYPNLTMGFGEEGQLIGRLVTNGNNHDVYWNYRDLDRIAEGYETQLQRVPLLRNYVQVKLEDTRSSEDKANFVLDGYALYNVPVRGTVAPYNPSQKNMFANFVDESGECQTYEYLFKEEKYEGNEAYDDGTLISTEINWTDVSNPIYMYERSNSKAINPTCLLIKVRYDSGGNVTDATPSTYYKLDFIYKDVTTHSNVYYNLLRNFIFTMNVNEVTGAGYGNVEEAIRQPASNNIGGDAVAEDYTNISDGTGRLFVSTTYILFTKEQNVDLYYKYIPDITVGSVSNGSVTITAPVGNVLKTGASVAATDEASGHYANWRKVTLTPKAVSSVSQSQDIIFAVDGLQRTVELVLRTPYILTVDIPEEIVTDIVKAPLNVNITLPTGIAESLFPLRLFISSEDNTIFPDYGTNMPAETMNGKYGFIKEISWAEYNASETKTFTCKFLTNCAASATTVYVDNEYFAQGSDEFDNPKMTSITIPNTQKVMYQKDNNYNPYEISNNRTETVTVSCNGNYVGTITTGVDNVIAEVTITNPDGFKSSDVLTFTFTDKYRRWKNRWSDQVVTYTATCTVEELLNGNHVLEFTRSN